MKGTTGSSQQVSPVKQAIFELRQMRSKLNDIEFRRHEPIAVIGAGMRLPGGINDLDSFWQALLAGVDAVREVPPERWDIDALYDSDPDAQGKMYSRHGGFLDQIDEFDSDFFGISPREATFMDPQQRLLLEVGWEALEMAGQAPFGLSESATGVFLGISGSDYSRLVLQNLTDIDVYAGTGTAFSVTASRLAYFLGLKGPCMAVDTACSSSLVALHLAVGSLRLGECSMALVGGVNLMVSPHFTINFCRARMLSFQGKCKTFDADADGYVRGEGCVLLALKRLSDAVTNGDNILGVVRGSAVNQDGRSAGITAPNGPSQEAVILEALKEAAVEPLDVGYVETHGTGTPLGDPIEAKALGSVMGRNRGKDLFLPIGSVKTNIGHLEAASGITGLLKTLLILKHGIIPPHLHFQCANPHIPFDELGLTIPTKAISWPEGKGKRIGGVSSFGFGGTNAHIILEAPPEQKINENEFKLPKQILTLSAPNKSALMELVSRFSKYLINQHDQSFVDTCFTLNEGRSHFGHRLAIVAEKSDDALKQLNALLSGQRNNVLSDHLDDKEQPPEVAFVFTGIGIELMGVGRQLYETQPFFRKILKRCEKLMLPHLENPLLQVMFPDSGASTMLAQSPYAEAALFSLEYGLAELWQSWGVKPEAVMGLGQGAYAAACVSGALSLENAVGLIFAETQHDIKDISYSDMKVSLVSSVTSKIVTRAEIGHSKYWQNQIHEPAQLANSLVTIAEQGVKLFVEIGPNGELSKMVEPDLTEKTCVILQSLNKERKDWDQLFETLGRLYVAGLQIDWQGFYQDFRHQRMPLPTYPFQREQYWLDLPESEEKKLTVDGPAVWKSVVDSARHQSLQVPIDLGLHTYQDKWSALERLATAYILDFLRQSNVFTKSGDRFTVSELTTTLHILPVYKELFVRWLERLGGEGFLKQSGDTFSSEKPLPDPEIAFHRERSRKALEDVQFLQEYMERCGDMLVSVLTGKESALETLFPGGSSETGEYLYQNWSLARYFNQISASTVKSYVEKIGSDRKIRVLEVGAGTGGTTSSVLPVLPPERSLYYYTDVSEVFFNQAEIKFKDYPFVRYGALDIEKSPQEQGYGTYGFDIIIAANVLHATRDLRQTMRNVHSLLAPDGFLLLYEVTYPHSWFDVTIGLIEGWQLFDDNLRTDGPLLSAHQWRELMQSSGFDEVAVFPESGSPTEILNSHVILGQASGGGKGSEKSTPVEIPESVETSYAIVHSEEKGAEAEDFIRQLKEGTEDERDDLLLSYVRDHVLRVLRRDPSKGLEKNRRLMDLGVDSMMAVELRNQLGTGLKLKHSLPATLIYDYPTIEAVARHLAKEVLEHWEENESIPEDEVDHSSYDADTSQVEDLSEEEMEKMVLEKLAAMKKED